MNKQALKGISVLVLSSSGELKNKSLRALLYSWAKQEKISLEQAWEDYAYWSQIEAQEPEKYPLLIKTIGSFKVIQAKIQISTENYLTVTVDHG